jgi:hypothetical protein
MDLRLMGLEAFQVSVGRGHARIPVGNIDPRRAIQRNIAIDLFLYIQMSEWVDIEQRIR